MTTDDSARFINELKKTYASALEVVEQFLPKQDRERFIAQWGIFLNQLSIPSSNTSKIGAIAAFLPLIELMDNLSGDEFKDTFSGLFITLIESLSTE